MLLLALTGCGASYRTIETVYLPGPVAAAPEAMTEERPIDSLMAAGRGAYVAGDLGSAEQAFAQLLRYDVRSWQANYYLGLIRSAGTDFGRAAVHFRSALTLAPREAGPRALIYTALAANCESEGALSLAEQHYRMALNLDSTAVAASEGLRRLATK